MTSPLVRAGNTPAPPTPTGRMRQGSTGLMPSWSPLCPAHGGFGSFTNLPSSPNRLVWEYTLITEIQRMHPRQTPVLPGISHLGLETATGHPARETDATNPHFPPNPEEFQLHHRTHAVLSSCCQLSASSSWHPVFSPLFCFPLALTALLARLEQEKRGRKEKK